MNPATSARRLSLLGFTSISTVCAAFLGGCASTGHAEKKEMPLPRQVSVFHGDGSPAAWNDLVASASASDVVLVGENHGHPLGLSSAAALWDDILAEKPQATLAMEFFERDEQAALDDYVAGLTDEAAFRKAAHRTDGSYPDGHRHMVEASKARSRPVVAANAPRRYVRIARTDGYEKLVGLRDEQKRLFRIPESLPTGPYREAFNAIMTPQGDSKANSHGDAPAADPAKEAARLDAAFRSQSLWDWTMADSVSRAVNEGGKPVLLVVGRFHVDKEGGTVLALRKINPGVHAVTVSFVNDWSTSLADEDKGRADYVVYVGPGPDEN